MAEHGIEPIDLVVVNLYPFASDPGIELIDVGGPAMVRAAAKNHAHVGVVVDPADYGPVLAELRAGRPAVGGDAAPAGPDGVRQHRRLRRRDRGLARRATTPADEPTPATALPATLDAAARAGPGAALRREPPPGRRPLPARRGVGLVGHRRPARRQGAQLPQPVRRRGGVAARPPLRRAGLRDRQARQPVRRRRRRRHHHRLRAGPRVRPGQRVRRHRRRSTGRCPSASAEALAPVFTEVVVAPGYDEDALAALTAKTNLRVLTRRAARPAGARHPPRRRRAAGAAARPGHHRPHAWWVVTGDPADRRAVGRPRVRLDGRAPP